MEPSDHDTCQVFRPSPRSGAGRLAGALFQRRGVRRGLYVGRVLAEVVRLNPAKRVSVGNLNSNQQDGPFRLVMSWVKALDR